MILPASYQSGFAPRDGEPLYPELWRGCVGAWNPSLGISGGVVRDWSGYKNDLVLTNMDLAVAWNSGTQHRKISVDGTNDYLVSERTLTGLRSVSGWWRTTSLSGFRRLFGINANAWAPYLTNGNMTLFQVYNGTTMPGSSTDPILNQWFHVSFTYDGSVARTWLNGRQTDSQTLAAATIDGFKIFFGQRSDSIQLFIGDMTGLMVHTRALPANEIMSLANRPLIAYELAPVRYAGESLTSFTRRLQHAQLIGGGLIG